jgi:GntR family transcriptional regulator
MAEPMYRQIAEDLREQIESGRLPAGSQVPTELELRDHYKASRNTIRDALRWLTAHGLIYARAGQGTFVAKKITPCITVLTEQPAQAPGAEPAYQASEPDETHKPSLSQVKVGVQKAEADLAATLCLSEGDEIVSRQQVRYIDGVPWSLQTSFYPRELAARGAGRLLSPENIAEGTLAYLQQSLGLEQVGHEDTIQVSPPTDDVARLFKLADDGRVAVITVHRTGYITRDGSLFPSGLRSPHFRRTVTSSLCSPDSSLTHVAHQQQMICV